MVLLCFIVFPVISSFRTLWHLLAKCVFAFTKCVYCCVTHTHLDTESLFCEYHKSIKFVVCVCAHKIESKSSLNLTFVPFSWNWMCMHTVSEFNFIMKSQLAHILSVALDLFYISSLSYVFFSLDYRHISCTKCACSKYDTMMHLTRSIAVCMKYESTQLLLLLFFSLVILKKRIECQIPIHFSFACMTFFRSLSSRDRNIPFFAHARRIHGF